MKILLMGPPGAGKGTQAELLSEKFHIPHISTGEILRAAIKSGKALGKKAKEYMDAGKLIPDEITIGIIKERLQQIDCKEGFILDGFPRTVPQADALDDILPKLRHCLDAVINIEVLQTELVARLTGRRVCPKCGATFHLLFNPPYNKDLCNKCGQELYQRADDSLETVENRLIVYEKQTAPLISYYEERNMLKGVSGIGTVSEVLAEICQALGRG